MVELAVLGGFEEHGELRRRVVDVVVGTTGVAHDNFAGVVAALWYWTSGLVVGLVGLAGAVLAIAVPTVRHGVVGVTRTIVTLHRVRSGLVQAGVGDRTGRPPWLPWARPTGAKGVVVGVWLRAGTTPGDLRAAAPVIAAACGATVVEVEQHGRDDRVEMHVVRPRWGWPGR
jgi:hypothetical protein